MRIVDIKNYFISAAAGTSAVFVRGLTNASTSNIEGFIYSVLAGVFTFVSLNIIFHIPSSTPFYRMLTKDEEKLVGHWIETVKKSGKIYYTLFNIFYVWTKDTYYITGLALDENGKIHADWHSLYVNFHQDLYELKFLFSAKEEGKQIMTGYAEIRFFRGNGYPPCEGKGFFVDMRIDPIRVEFEIQRINKELIKELLGVKYKRIKPELRQKFIKLYHNYKKDR